MTENRMGSKHPLELAQEILLARLKHCPVSDAKLEAAAEAAALAVAKMQFVLSDYARNAK